MTSTASNAAAAEWATDVSMLLALIWCIPAAVLLVGLPLVAAVRLVVELISRVLG